MKFYHHLMAIFVAIAVLTPNCYADTETIGSAYVEAIVEEELVGRVKFYSILTKITFKDFPNLYKFNSLEFEELDIGVGGFRNSGYRPENGESIILRIGDAAIFSAKSQKIILRKNGPNTIFAAEAEYAAPKYVHYDIQSYESAKLEVAQKRAAQLDAAKKADEERNSLTGRIMSLFGK